ncbi:MAG: hypothetical protein CMJ76_10655 [Planctomycetaceae bacterium]|nr:hypothetical protein [Planctomycetaceae bacterium]
MAAKHDIQRRLMLRAGLLAGTTLSLADQLFRSELSKARTGSSPTNKNCILLYMTGGPAQQETFDMKPDCDDRFRGEFLPASTKIPGIQICEHLPGLASQIDKYAIIRSTWHESNTHGVGVHYNLTGLKHAPRQRGEPQVSRDDPPSIGGALRQLRGDRNGLPAAVHLPVRIGDQNNFRWGGQHAGFLGQQYDPLTLIEESWKPGTLPTSFLPPEGVGVGRLRDRVQLLKNVEKSTITGSKDDNPELYQQARERALSILQSDSVWKAFLIEEETPTTIDRYGDNKFGRSCLVARRLVERGVSFVTVPWMHLHSTKNFDTHANHFKVMKDLLLPPMDQAMSALFEDLQQRGLLDTTLVAWTGEFGRTPTINRNAGRDHWGKVYSTLLAGAGIRGGQVYGSTDNIGGEPKDHPVYVSDFIATIYKVLGYDSSTLVHDRFGRPHPIVQGTPVKALYG